MKKNPHAVALGRKGGKKTGRKGFAAMEPAKAKRIRGLAAYTRKAMTEPHIETFERAIETGGWFKDVTAQRERAYVYNREFVLPLVEAGYLIENRIGKQPHGSTSFYYCPTAEGIHWWARRKLEEAKESEVVLNSLLEDFDQKSAGDVIAVHYFRFYAGLRAILEGLATFVSYRYDYGFAYLSIRLTAAGEDFWKHVSPPLGEW